MGILTDVTYVVDESVGVRRVFAITKWGIGTRSELNRVSGRVALGSGVGQRSLVAAAYDEEDIDLVWNKGLGVTVAPEEKFPDAKEINYRSMNLEEASNATDLWEILPDFIRDKIEFGKRTETKTLHIWEIPLDITK